MQLQVVFLSSLLLIIKLITSCLILGEHKNNSCDSTVQINIIQFTQHQNPTESNISTCKAFLLSLCELHYQTVMSLIWHSIFLVSSHGLFLTMLIKWYFKNLFMISGKIFFARFYLHLPPYLSKWDISVALLCVFWDVTPWHVKGQYSTSDCLIRTALIKHS